MNEITIAIIKPDAVRLGIIGPILTDAGISGLYPTYMRLDSNTMWLGGAEAKWAAFYAEHEGKPFYEKLIKHMSSGPCVILALEGPCAIKHWRIVMGDTNPFEAAPGTIRRKWGAGGPANVVHGSDSPESVRREARLLGVTL